MTPVPIQLYLIPLFVVTVGVAMFVHRRASQAAREQEFAAFRAGDVARRLRLELTEGDPQFNLAIGNATAAVRRGLIDTRRIDVHIRMQGEPFGVPLELSYVHTMEQRSVLAYATVRTSFDCRMSARARRPFPPFEVVSRATPWGPVARTEPLPEIAAGVLSVDSAYIMATREPAMAHLLAASLPEFAVFANAGIHLVGNGETVAFVMGRDKPPTIALALSFAETMSRLLAELARGVGG